MQKRLIMGKILDAEFRKELYKNLVDAGYEGLYFQFLAAYPEYFQA